MLLVVILLVVQPSAFGGCTPAVLFGLKEMGHWSNQEDPVTAGQDWLWKNRQACHPEEAKPTKGLHICLKIQMQGSFAEFILSQGAEPDSSFRSE